MQEEQLGRVVEGVEGVEVVEVMEAPRGGVTVVGVTAGGAGVAVLVRLPVALVRPPVGRVRRTHRH